MGRRAGATAPMGAWCRCLPRTREVSRKPIGLLSRVARYEKRRLSQRRVLALPGTFGAAERRLKASVKWLAHDDSTRFKNSRLIEEFLALRVVPDHPLTWRDVPVKNLRRGHVKSF